MGKHNNNRQHIAGRKPCTRPVAADVQQPHVLAAAREPLPDPVQRGQRGAQQPVHASNTSHHGQCVASSGTVPACVPTRERPLSIFDQRRGTEATGQCARRQTRPTHHHCPRARPHLAHIGEERPHVRLQRRRRQCRADETATRARRNAHGTFAARQRVTTGCRHVIQRRAKRGVPSTRQAQRVVGHHTRSGGVHKS